jgi:hypothetical protein
MPRARCAGGESGIDDLSTPRLVGSDRERARHGDGRHRAQRHDSITHALQLTTTGRALSQVRLHLRTLTLVKLAVQQRRELLDVEMLALHQV